MQTHGTHASCTHRTHAATQAALERESVELGMPRLSPPLRAETAPNCGAVGRFRSSTTRLRCLREPTHCSHLSVALDRATNAVALLPSLTLRRTAARHRNARLLRFIAQLTPAHRGHAGSRRLENRCGGVAPYDVWSHCGHTPHATPLHVPPAHTHQAGRGAATTWTFAARASPAPRLPCGVIARE
jgi:hypothetical protein